MGKNKKPVAIKKILVCIETTEGSVHQVMLTNSDAESIIALMYHLHENRLLVNNVAIDALNFPKKYLSEKTKKALLK